MTYTRIVLIALIVLGTSVLASLYAASSTGATISLDVSGGNRVDVQMWEQGQPAWQAVEGAVGIIQPGGIARIIVPANGPRTWDVVLYLTNPDDLVKAYSYWLPGVGVRAIDTALLIPGESVLPSIVAGGDATQSTYSNGLAIASELRRGDTQILTWEKGRVSLRIDATRGVGIDDQGIFQTDPGLIDSYVFELGFAPVDGQDHAGTFFASDASDVNNLSPAFLVQVEPVS